MKFNKEQREGFARACDTLAVTAIVGFVVGIAGHSPLKALEIAGLGVITPVLFFAGYLFRK